MVDCLQVVAGVLDPAGPRPAVPLLAVPHPVAVLLLPAPGHPCFPRLQNQKELPFSLLTLLTACSRLPFVVFQ